MNPDKYTWVEPDVRKTGRSLHTDGVKIRRLVHTEDAKFAAAYITFRMDEKFGVVYHKGGENSRYEFGGVVDTLEEAKALAVTLWRMEGKEPPDESL